MSDLVFNSAPPFALRHRFGILSSILVLLLMTSCTSQITPTANPAAQPTSVPAEAAIDSSTSAASDQSELTAEATNASTMSPGATATAADQSVIVLADISADNPASVIEAFQPLADYLAANLGDYGITTGEVRVASDIETMAVWLESGEVDLFFDSPYPALIVSDLSGGEPILRRWKEGVSEYHSVVFTLAEGDIEALGDLQGNIIAFDAPTSTSGYMLPLAYLVEAGFTATEQSSNNAAVADDEIGYIFSDGDNRAIQLVLSGRVGAAVVDSGSFADISQETRDQLTILLETEPLPRQVAVIRPNIDADLRTRIEAVLMAMDESEEGRAVLETFEETAQFDEFPGGAETALNRMRELFERVQNQ